METIAIILFIVQLVMSQVLELMEQPELKKNLVGRLPVKEGNDLPSTYQPWQDIAGLGWIFHEEWD